LEGKKEILKLKIGSEYLIKVAKNGEKFSICQMSLNQIHSHIALPKHGVDFDS
jgi:hypothetical protein